MSRSLLPVGFYIGGWKDPVSYIIFAVVGLGVFGLLTLFFDIAVAFVIGFLTAGIVEYYLIEILPQIQEEREEREQQAEVNAQVKDLVDKTTNCMSCMKPLGNLMECPHCGFDMSEIIRKRDT